MDNGLPTRLLDECAKIPDEELRLEVQRIIEAAKEEADEFVARNPDDDDEDGDQGWEDAFFGTIETETDDANDSVKEWFESNC
jgi:hypothetical protein